MSVVGVGDRVQILCASRRGDGTHLESKSERLEPYWIRAEKVDGDLQRAAQAVVGMRIGERRSLTCERNATSEREAHQVFHDLEVLAIRKGTSTDHI